MKKLSIILCYLAICIGITVNSFAKNPKNTYSAAELEAAQAEAIEKQKALVYLNSNSKSN